MPEIGGEIRIKQQKNTKQDQKQNSTKLYLNNI